MLSIFIPNILSEIFGLAVSSLACKNLRSHQSILTNKKPNKLKNQQLFLNPSESEFTELTASPKIGETERWIQEYLYLMHFIEVVGVFLFLQIEILWQLCLEQAYLHPFSNSICSLYDCIRFWQFSQYFKIFHYYFVMVISNLILPL